MRLFHPLIISIKEQVALKLVKLYNKTRKLRKYWVRLGGTYSKHVISLWGNSFTYEGYNLGQVALLSCIFKIDISLYFKFKLFYWWQQNILFHYNFIIRLVLVYRSKENLGFKVCKSFLFHFFYPTFTFLTFISSCEKNTGTSSGCFQENKSVKLHTLRENQKYQATSVFVKRNSDVNFWNEQKSV